MGEAVTSMKGGGGGREKGKGAFCSRAAKLGRAFSLLNAWGEQAEAEIAEKGEKKEKKLISCHQA